MQPDGRRRNYERTEDKARQRRRRSGRGVVGAHHSGHTRQEYCDEYQALQLLAPTGVTSLCRSGVEDERQLRQAVAATTGGDSGWIRREIHHPGMIKSRTHTESVVLDMGHRHRAA